jgi:hypothetical protein
MEDEVQVVGRTGEEGMRFASFHDNHATGRELQRLSVDPQL